MFPKFLSFCKTQHRSPKINSMLTYICQNISKLSGNKKGTNLLFLDLSQEVNPLVRNSNSFLEDLRRLSQLKESPLQKDIKVHFFNKLFFYNLFPVFNSPFCEIINNCLQGQTMIG